LSVAAYCSGASNALPPFAPVSQASPCCSIMSLNNPAAPKEEFWAAAVPAPESWSKTRTELAAKRLE